MIHLGRYYESFLKIGRITSKNEVLLKYITERALKEGHKIEREENTLMLVGKDPWTIQDKIKELFVKDKLEEQEILINRQEFKIDYDKIKLMS